MSRANEQQLVLDRRQERAFVDSLGWPRGAGPLYRRLADALCDAVEELPAGTLLPPERRLAELLSISRTTVVAAYNLLRHDGRLESRTGSGTRVAGRALTNPRKHPSAGRNAVALRGVVDRDRDTIDFAAAGFGSDGILTEELQANAYAELRSLSKTPGYYPHGLPSLRDAIARHLSETGLPTDASQILVTNGAQQAIYLVSQLLVRRGSAVVVENPTYVGALDIFASTGARLVGVPVDEQEDSVDALRELVRREQPCLVYLMPTFHNPTGAVSTLARRQRLAALAAEIEAVLVEDDTLAQLAIEQMPPTPIAAFDRDRRIITIGSLSKTVWAGLRVGWIRAHSTLIDRLVSLKTVADLACSLPSQALARQALGDYPRIIAIRREQLGAALHLVTRRLNELIPEWEVPRPPGGQSLWLRLPRGDGEAFARLALKHRVGVIPGSLLSPDASFPHHIRFQFLQPHEVLEEGIRRLARAWEEYDSGHVRNLSVIV